jgi:SHS2 domain-containing protein
VTGTPSHEPPAALPEGWEHFEVVADIGVHAWGPDLAACFRQAALGVFQLVVPPAAVAPREHREVSARGDGPEALLVDWLNELLYLHEIEGFAVHDVAALELVDGVGLHARVLGEPIDPTRHPIGIQVKAATFHQLAVIRQADRVDARVVLDV